MKTAAQLYQEAVVQMHRYRHQADDLAWQGKDASEADRLYKFWQKEALTYAAMPHDELIPDH